MYQVLNRLKTAVNQLDITDRMQYQPEILEFHLVEDDLYGQQKELAEAISYVQSKGTKVYLHHPMKTGNRTLDIISNYPDVRAFYQESCRILHEICSKNHIKCVLHCNYAQSDNSIHISHENTVKVKHEIESILTYGKHTFLWEDSINGTFSFKNPHLFSRIIQPLQLPLVQDVSHSFIALSGNNEKLLAITKQISPFVQYMHLVDSLGQSHDGLPLGEGLIHWNNIKPHTLHKDFIFEISLDNVHDCRPMIQSCAFYNSI
ncbi:hypothetical protein CN918_27870 [Priestia megaterium]|nr:hypothetical protein CN918_27870 [Priestia megaterium]